jgi:Cdc6-like AAA superfamily ATPase
MGLLVRVRMRLLQRLGLGRAPPPPRINTLLQMISRRAERLDAHQQAETFVSLGGIEHTLLNRDNRVIFGRRGTGKTHVMSFVADAAKKKGEMALLLDLRTSLSHFPSERHICSATFYLHCTMHYSIKSQHPGVVTT